MQYLFILPASFNEYVWWTLMKKPNPKIVVVAVIEKDGFILIGKRKQGKRNIGKWEFPGGTLEERETYEQCLKRELREELAISVEVGDLICSSTFVYAPDWTTKMLAFRTTCISGMPCLKEHNEIRWVKPADLYNYDFPEADIPIIEKLVMSAN